MSYAEELGAHYAAVRSRLKHRKRDFMDVNDQRTIPIRFASYADQLLEEKYGGVDREAIIALRRPHEKILVEVLEKYGVTIQEFRGSGRQPAMINARREFAYRAQKECGLTLYRIAKLSNAGDHTVIKYRIEAWKKAHGLS